MRSPYKSLHFWLGILGAFCLTTCLAVAPAQAQSTTGTGFQLNRYEPTAAGEWSFWVDHPWYSTTRYFAAGVTLNYAHNPLLFGITNADGSFSRNSAVVAHHLLGHVDLAGSFLDRVLLSVSLPVVFLEQGTSAPGSNVSASNQVSVGDLRFGAMVRLFGQPYRKIFYNASHANTHTACERHQNGHRLRPRKYTGASERGCQPGRTTR